MLLKPHKPLPDFDYLHRRLSYEADTGVLRWKLRPLEDFDNDFMLWNWWTKRFGGKVAGHSAKSNGAWIVSIDSIQYYQHRVIWKMLNGEDPPTDIDHRYRDRTSNLPDEIRLATRQENSWNRKVRVDSRWGLKGIQYRAKKRRFEAYIMKGGKRKYLGMFKTAEEAHQAYCEAAKIAYGEFWSDGT